MLAAGEIMQRSVDAELLQQASREHRILLTEDKDFGWLVFVSSADSSGVVLLRYPGNARSALADTVVQLVTEHGAELMGGFTVVQPGYTRISHSPSN